MPLVNVLMGCRVKFPLDPESQGEADHETVSQAANMPCLPPHPGLEAVVGQN